MPERTSEEVRRILDVLSEASATWGEEETSNCVYNFALSFEHVNF